MCAPCILVLSGRTGACPFLDLAADSLSVAVLSRSCFVPLRFRAILSAMTHRNAEANGLASTLKSSGTLCRPPYPVERATDRSRLRDGERAAVVRCTVEQAGRREGLGTKHEGDGLPIRRTHTEMSPKCPLGELRTSEVPMAGPKTLGHRKACPRMSATKARKPTADAEDEGRSPWLRVSEPQHRAPCLRTTWLRTRSRYVGQRLPAIHDRASLTDPICQLSQRSCPCQVFEGPSSDLQSLAL